MNDSTIYKASKLESTFIEICNPKTFMLLLNVSINIQIRTLMNSNDHLKELFDKLFKEKKNVSSW